LRRRRNVHEEIAQTLWVTPGDGKQAPRAHLPQAWRHEPDSGTGCTTEEKDELTPSAVAIGVNPDQQFAWPSPSLGDTTRSSLDTVALLLSRQAQDACSDTDSPVADEHVGPLVPVAGDRVRRPGGKNDVPQLSSRASAARER